MALYFHSNSVRKIANRRFYSQFYASLTIKTSVWANPAHEGLAWIGKIRKSGLNPLSGPETLLVVSYKLADSANAFSDWSHS